MKTINFFLFILLTVFSQSCTRTSNAVVTYNNDIETALAWTDFPAPNIIKMPNAHSGQYVCKIEEGAAFSPTFNMKVPDISKDKFASVTISAWIMAASQDADPNLVLEIRDGSGKTKEWLPKSITGTNLHLHKWEPFETTINLEVSDRLNPANTYRIYISNGRKEHALIDDIEIRFNK